jgi:hypothetical protein
MRREKQCSKPLFLHGRQGRRFVLSPMGKACESCSKTLGLVQDLEKTFRLRLEFCIVGTHCTDIAFLLCQAPSRKSGMQAKARPTFFTT